MDPELAAVCRKAKRLNNRLLWVAVAIWGIGFSAAYLALPTFASDTRIVEVHVQGMACAFCVEGLLKTLNKLPGVENATVSLKNNLARLELDPQGAPDTDAIKQAILDAGFTPGDVRDIP